MTDMMIMVCVNEKYFILINSGFTFFKNCFKVYTMDKVSIRWRL